MAGGIERIRVLVLEGLSQGGALETVLRARSAKFRTILDFSTSYHVDNAREMADWADRIVVIPYRKSEEFKFIDAQRRKLAVYSTNELYNQKLREYGITVFLAPDNIDQLMNWVVRGK